MYDRAVRERFVEDYLGKGGQVEWLFFENDSSQCRINAQVLEHRSEGHRAHRLREIDRVTTLYDIPSEAVRRPVYRSVS